MDVLGFNGFELLPATHNINKKEYVNCIKSYTTSAVFYIYRYNSMFYGAIDADDASEDTEILEYHIFHEDVPNYY